MAKSLWKIPSILKKCSSNAARKDGHGTLSGEAQSHGDFREPSRGDSKAEMKGKGDHHFTVPHELCLFLINQINLLVTISDKWNQK